ncbi:MAG: hypothetical protein ACRYHC_01725 [Janthinobacterium lividum]
MTTTPVPAAPPPPVSPADTVPQTKSFSGGYLLYRKLGGKNVRPGVRSQAREPRFRHPSFAAAETEAQRLLPHHPESTFIILQEVARVKLKPVEIAGD